MRVKPIEFLSGRGYYKRKRLQIIIITIITLAAACCLFYFTGKNLKYFLYVKSGVSNFEKNRIAYAMSDFNKALNIKPNSPLAIDGLGLIYVKQGDFERAEKTYAEAITAGLKSNSLINHVKYGDAYLDMGAYKNAEMEFAQAVKLNSIDSKALYGLGCCYHAYGSLDTAINYYTKSLTYSPKFTPARKNLTMAEDDKNKGAIYYLFDRNSDPLARQNLIASEGKKTYILDQKAAHLTGYDSDKHGKAGLEAALAPYLPGNRIYLTIDSNVQKIISSAMGWYKGAIVVLRPSTGEILGYYSQPTYRPNAIDKNWWEYYGNANKPLLNRAFDKLYEPGSIAKLITVSAAFETGVNLSKVFPKRCAGSTVFNNKVFWCSEKHGWVRSLEQAIETSCNIGTAFLGFAVGSAALSEYDTRFGFNDSFDIGFDDPVRKSEVKIPVQKSVSPLKDSDNYSIAMHSCGLAPDKSDPFLITPLHAAMLAAAIGNGGVMMKPYLVREIRNVNGRLIYEGQPSEYKRPISPATAEKLKALMISAVEKGIGQKAKVKGLLIAGKTGTSDSSSGNLKNAWFISFAPADKPEYAIAILGDGEGKGMIVSAPIAGEIYKALLK
jgi:peptidoglycan glycosyltransferase